MSTTTARLLQAASERAGGAKALAERLGITESTLTGYMADGTPLPDPLLLRVVDIVLAERSRFPLVIPPQDLQETPGSHENGFDGGSATPGAGAAE